MIINIPIRTINLLRECGGQLLEADVLSGFFLQNTIVT